MKRTFHKTDPRPSLWRHRDLRLVLPARTLSFVGDELAMIALTLRVHDQGGGTLGVALLMAAFALPTVLLMGVAGSVADRVDSRVALLVSTGLQVAACVGLALVSGSWATYLLVVVLQCGQAVANPTWGALVPRIAGDQDVGRVLALQQSLLAVTAIAGAALAGLVVGTHGSAAALWLDAATFGGLLVAAALVRTRRGGARAGSRERATRTRTLDGLRVLRRDRLVWLVFVWTVPFVIVLEGVNVVEVFLVRDDLGASATTYGLLQAFFGAGAVVGSWRAGRCGTDPGRVRLLLAGLAGTAGAIVLAGMSPAAAFLAAVAGPARRVQRGGQRHAGPALRAAHPRGGAGPGPRRGQRRLPHRLGARAGPRRCVRWAGRSPGDVRARRRARPARRRRAGAGRCAASSGPHRQGRRRAGARA